MKNFYTSLIAAALLLFAAFSANAAIPDSLNSFGAHVVSAEQAETMNLVEPFQKVCRTCGDVFQTHSYSLAVCMNCSAKMFERVQSGTNSNYARQKTETPKRVNPKILQTFYPEPPDIRAYNGIGFANLARARPL